MVVLVFVPSYTPSRARVTRPMVMGNPPGTVRTLPEVWPVEQTERFDLYSNGLRIENEFAVSNEPRRAFPVYPAGASDSDKGDRPVEWRNEPAGIVFHSTESHQAAFDPAEVNRLKRIGRNLLDFVRSQRSYHFVIDRFGRAYRVVRETDVAHHAGKSVWADSTGVYVNLNSSFIAVALESQSDASVSLSDAQVHAAAVLTQMLRSRFHISAYNCVTHAQVSVNPSNMKIGYHTDWGVGFPFDRIGLPDNYARPVSSLVQFGFGYDEAFEQAIGGRVWPGIGAAESVIATQAKSAGADPEAFRKRLQQRYRRIINAQTRMTEENQDEI